MESNIFSDFFKFLKKSYVWIMESQAENKTIFCGYFDEI